MLKWGLVVMKLFVYVVCRDQSIIMPSRKVGESLVASGLGGEEGHTIIKRDLAGIFGSSEITSR